MQCLKNWKKKRQLERQRRAFFALPNFDKKIVAYVQGPKSIEQKWLRDYMSSQKQFVKLG